MTANDPIVLLAQALLVVIPLALSLAVQQYAQARTAKWLGDDTAERAGRLTLNPLVHIDPVGTLALPMLSVLLAGQGGMLPLIGWARPAPVNFQRMSRRFSATTCATWLASAAPLASMLLAALAAVLLVLSWRANSLGANAAASLPIAGALPAVKDLASKLLYINVALSLFQLLPIGPLSGFVLLCALLPDAMGPSVRAFNNRYGQWLLILLLVFGRGLLGPPVRFVAGALLAVVANIL